MGLLLDAPRLGEQGDGANDRFPSICAMHRIAFYVFPDFQLLDLSGPLAAFQRLDQLAPEQAYDLRVLSRQGGGVRSTAGITIDTLKPGRAMVDTLIVVGGRGAHRLAEQREEREAVRRLARRANRVASVCTGAVILAAVGLLDGRRVTTHWRYAAQLQRRYPALKVEGDRIYIRDGHIWTSAGITAGIDLALAMIEQDLGLELSRAAARELVVQQRRSGDQSQFSEALALEPESDRVRMALDFARAHLHKPLPVERLAEAACLGTRQFSRLFRAETGETPARAVERLRVEAARHRVEAGHEPIERIAIMYGFNDPERMRRAFVRRFGHPPQALRRQARGDTRRY